MARTPAPVTASSRITLEQVAELRGVSTKTVRRWVAAGWLPAYRTGPRLLRVDPADLALLERRILTAGVGHE